jgi:hypothetical protein
MTCLASDLEECQKSVHKACSSPSMAGFRSLTSPSSSQRREGVSFGAFNPHTVLQRASIHPWHLPAETGEVKLSIPIYPLERKIISLVSLVIELKKKLELTFEVET